MDDLSSSFLRWGFGPDWQQVFVNSFKGDPANAPSGVWSVWSVGTLIKAGRWPLPAGNNNYFCVSLFKGDRRQEVDFKVMPVLAFDDVGVGKKVDPGLLLDQLGTPGWACETSPGNQQWFYGLRPGVADLVVAKRLLGLVHNDAKEVTRLMRLPVGMNLKPAHGAAGFKTRVISGARIQQGQQSEGILDPEKVLASWDAGAVPDAAGGLGSSRLLSTKAGLSVDDLIGNDVVGQWLLRLGRVKRLTSSRLAVEVICPWEADHTVKTESGAAYFPRTGGFECHHGHCAGKTGNDLRAWLEEEIRRSGLWDGIYEFEPVVNGGTSQDAAGGGGGAGSAGGGGIGSNDDDDRPYREKILDKYVYVAGDDKFLDLIGLVLLSDKALNYVETEPLGPWLSYTVDGVTKQMKPREWLRQNGVRMASKQTYWPGRGRFFKDEDGVLLVNRWMPLARPLKGMAITEKDVEPWLELIDEVCADEGPETAERLKDWLALVVGAPTVKPGWHPLLRSEIHGIGKGLIIKPVQMLLNTRHHAATPSLHDIGHGQFTEFLEKRLVVFDELKSTTRGQATSHDVYGRLKSWTENSSPTRPINPKYGKPYDALNASCWYLTANEDAPLPLEESDRRFLVIDSTMTPHSIAHYEQLAAWIEAKFQEVGEYLWRRWETMPAQRRAVLLGRAPMTAGKQTMIRRGEHPLLSWTRQQIEDGVWPDLMTPEDIRCRYQQAVRDRILKGVPTDMTAAVLLKKLAAQKANGGNPIRTCNGLVRVWVIRDTTKYGAMLPHEIAKAYELQTNSLFL